MDYKIDNNKIRLLQIEQIISEVEELKKMLADEGCDFTFDEVFKLYAYNEISKKLDEILPVE